MANVIETDSETISNCSLNSKEYEEEVEEYNKNENNNDEGRLITYFRIFQFGFEIIEKYFKLR